jgi:hypothetical protein
MIQIANSTTSKGPQDHADQQSQLEPSKELHPATQQTMNLQIRFAILTPTLNSKAPIMVSKTPMIIF